MTDLQLLYNRERLTNGLGHHAALRSLERSTGIDRGTIQRCLRRAERNDERDAKGRG